MKTNHFSLKQLQAVNYAKPQMLVKVCEVAVSCNNRWPSSMQKVAIMQSIILRTVTPLTLQ